jgi:hypothetical protein
MLGVRLYNFMQLGGRDDFLRHSIWSRVPGLMRFRNGSDTETASNFVQILAKLRQTPRQ